MIVMGKGKPASLIGSRNKFMVDNDSWITKSLSKLKVKVNRREISFSLFLKKKVLLG